MGGILNQKRKLLQAIFGVSGRLVGIAQKSTLFREDYGLEDNFLLLDGVHPVHYAENMATQLDYSLRDVEQLAIDGIRSSECNCGVYSP